jgi:excisionase family DNA binding protein
VAGAVQVIACYYTADMAAEVLEVSPITVMRWCRAGKLIGEKREDGRWYVEESVLGAFLDDLSRWDNHLTAEQAAERLSVAASTISKMCRTGRLDGTRTPTGWRITPESVEAELTRSELRRTQYCRECGLDEPLRDGLCVHCHAAKSGQYAWYPLPSRMAERGRLQLSTTTG